MISSFFKKVFSSNSSSSSSSSSVISEYGSGPFIFHTLTTSTDILPPLARLIMGYACFSPEYVVSSIGSDSGLTRPTSAICYRDTVYVLDEQRSRVQCFSVKSESPTGVIIGGYGSGQRQLKSPKGLHICEIDGKDVMFICDTGNSRIAIYKNGSFDRHLKGLPSFTPTAVTYDSGRVFVSDSAQHCIFVYKYDDLTLLYRFSATANKKKKSVEAKEVSSSIDSANAKRGVKPNADHTDDDDDKKDYEPQSLKNPHGIVIHTKTKNETHWNEQDDDDDEEEEDHDKSSSSSSTRVDCLRSPLDRQKRLYVCDTGNHRIAIFRLSGRFVYATSSTAAPTSSSSSSTSSSSSSSSSSVNDDVLGDGVPHLALFSPSHIFIYGAEAFISTSNGVVVMDMIHGTRKPVTLTGVKEPKGLSECRYKLYVCDYETGRVIVFADAPQSKT